MNASNTIPHVSISNLAWPQDSDAEALDSVARIGFAGVELMPYKIFGSWSVPAQTIAAYRRAANDRGLLIPALQGITFGAAGLHLFGSDAQRGNLANHLAKVADLAADLGATMCVFGAPSLRDPGNLAPEQAFDIAVNFFSKVAEHFAARKACLCFEPNPARYGCRFVTTTAEAACLVRAVGHQGFGLQLDAGTIIINGETEHLPDQVGVARHFHASEPDLVPLGGAEAHHMAIGKILDSAGYSGWRSVEMKPASDWRSALARSSQIMRKYYADDVPGPKS
jgi:D-psicose/D-tagatose/L-ribulose 3-epimerase